MIRAVGVLLLLVGLMVIAEAWELYNEPARIEKIARKVEAGSNLDKSLSHKAPAVPAQTQSGTLPFGATPSQRTAAPAPELRLSYFAA